MKFYKTITFTIVGAFATLFLASCNAPLVNNTLALPGRMIHKVVGPAFGR